MDPNTLFSKCITLLYRESQIENATENSADLVRTAIEKIKINDVSVGIATKQNTSQNLRDLVIEMCRKDITHQYDPVELLQQIRLITNGDENLYKAIAQGIEPEFTQTILKRMVTNIRKTIADQSRENRLAEIVSKASRDLTFGRHNITDITSYIRNVISELEVTSSKSSAKDPGVVKSMNFGDDDSMREVFHSVASSNGEDLVFRTPWRELNEALQGGPRPGDCMVTAALQHNYKTGANLTLFTFLPILNKPKNTDPNKKPLVYRISFEDPLRNNAQFMYQLLKFDETKEPVDIKSITVEEMQKYVKERMTVNGYHVLMEEVNPNNWTYLDMINRIVQLESEGYVVEALFVDYLSKLPTTGCVQGAIGDDVMDLLSRTRAFCSAHGMLFASPHQLSTDAKRKLETIAADQFLHFIKGGGFFEKTKGLDRIYDIGVLIHKVSRGDDDFLHMVLDKHRFPTVVENSKKSWFLPFPKGGMPIPSNLDDEDYKVYRKIPRILSTKDDDFFI